MSDIRIDFWTILSATVAMVFTMGAIVAVWQLLAEIRRGGTLSIESRWGGLGGGLGGWKLSREASLLLVAAILIVGAVTAVRRPDTSDAARKSSAPPVTDGPTKPSQAPAPTPTKP